MKTIGRWLIPVCVLALPVASQEGHDRGAAEAVRALEREWEVAQSHNDNRALDMIIDNDLVYIEDGRLVTKGVYLERIHSEPPSLREVVTEPTMIRMFGNTAIVVGTRREKDMVNGRLRLQRWRFIDSWVYKKNRWMLVAAAAVPVTE